MNITLHPVPFEDMNQILQIMPDPTSIIANAFGHFDYSGFKASIKEQFNVDAYATGGVEVRIENPTTKAFLKLYDRYLKFVAAGMGGRRGKFYNLQPSEIMWMLGIDMKETNDYTGDYLNVTITAHDIKVRVWGNPPPEITMLLDVARGTAFSVESSIKTR